MRLHTISSNYRWYILALAAATYALVAGAERMSLPVLFKEISDDLGLSKVEIGVIWGMEPLAGVFVVLVGGLLVDRFGVKRTLTVLCGLAGFFGALRGLSGNFLSFAAIMFLFGLAVAMTPSVVPKATAVWFAGRHLGLANGVLTVGMTVGSMMATMISATVLSPWLGGWRNVLFLYGVPPIIIGLLWLATGREPHEGEGSLATSGSVPFRQALTQVVHIRQLWAIGFIKMGQMGAFVAMIAYLPLYLREIGWAPASADSAITVFIGVSAIGAIPMLHLSDRLGTRKGMLVPTLFAIAITLGLLPVADGLAVWALIVVNGLLRGGVFPLFTTLVVETRGVGAAYAGTAIGLTTTFAMLGGFFSPPLGNSLASAHPGLPFVLWAAQTLVSLLGFLFVKEVGRDKREAYKASKEVRQRS